MNKTIPKPINIENREYYQCTQLLEYKPEFFYGYASRLRRVIEKRKIEQKDYFLEI